MTQSSQPTARSPAVPDDLEKASLDTVYQQLGTTPKGLTSAEAKARIEKYGRNELVAKEISDLEKFLRFFWGPIAWMIEAAALLSLLMGHWADLTIILVLLFYNAISGFWQERKASDALAALKAEPVRWHMRRLLLVSGFIGLSPPRIAVWPSGER